MKKRNFAMMAVVAMLVVLTFAGCQPRYQIIPIPGGGDGGSSSTDVLTSTQQQKVRGALSALFDIVKKAVSSASNQSWSSDEYTGKYNLTVNGDGSWNLEAWGTENSTRSVIARTVPEGDWDITIRTSSATVSSVVSVTLDGTSYVVPVSEVVDNVNDIPAERTLEITVRPAKHLRGFAEDHNNWKFVGDITVADGGTVTIPVDTDGMISFASTNQSQGEAKWISVLVGVEGITDIKEITWNNYTLTDADVNDADDMLDSAGNKKPNSNEFVLWLKADSTGASTNTIKVGNLTKTLTFKFVDYEADYVLLEKEEIEDFSTAFFEYSAMLAKPAHLRTFHRLSYETLDLNAGDDSTFTINNKGSLSVSDNSLAFDLSWNGYHFESTDTYTVTGNLTMTFTGTVADKKLTATDWRIESDELTFSDGSDSYVIEEVDISGDITTDSAFGTEDGNLVFELNEGEEYTGKISDLPEKDAGTEDPCFKLHSFGEDSTVSIADIRRTVTGAQINAFVEEAMKSQGQ